MRAPSLIAMSCAPGEMSLLAIASNKTALQASNNSSSKLASFAFRIRVWLIGSALVLSAGIRASCAADLETASYQVKVSDDTGRVTRIFDKTSQIELLTEPRLAGNFRILIPLPTLEGNYIDGSKQRVESIERVPDALTIKFRSPLVNDQGTFDVKVAMRIEAVGDELQFKLNVDNQTSCKVAEVWYPVLGGITGFGDRHETRELVPGSHGGSTGTELFQHFESTLPGSGLTVADAFWSYPTIMPMPWADIYNLRRNRGVYFASYDSEPRYRVLRFELNPGAGSSSGDNWPSARDVPPGVPIGVRMHWVYFPYLEPHQSFETPLAVLRFHDGDWHAGAAIFRDWFDKNFKRVDPRSSWLRAEPAYTNTVLLLPEGNVLFTFRDIPKLAKDASSHRINAMIILGWNKGGHDNGYPDYEPDERLGTWSDLEEGIREAHRLGVKVFLFANLQPVSPLSLSYNSLSQFRSMDSSELTHVYGWGMGTLEARLGFTRKPLVMMSPAFPDYREMITKQMVRIARAGADGVHIDKFSCLCGLEFNPHSPLPPDRAESGGELAALKEIFDRTRAVNPNFALSVECPWDRVLSYTDVGWWGKASEDSPVFKYTFSDSTLGVAIPQPADYASANQAVRYGYQIMAGGGNFNRSIDYEPFRLMADYVAELDRIRTELKDVLIYGDFIDRGAAEVKVSGPGAYSVFVSEKTGRHAVVTVNNGTDKATFRVTTFGARSHLRALVYTPFSPVREAEMPVNVELRPNQLAVVAEQ